MKKYIGLSIMALSLLLTSCDDWLDKLPDNRMELQSTQDLSDLLVSAYPTRHPAYLLEMYSDNSDDCDNTGWTEASRFQRQAFHWDDITEIGEDETPQELWNGYYSAVAAANASLDFIETLDASERANFKAQEGEALLCRAYSMFVLSTIFCNAYNAQTADSELGLPYPVKTETTVGQTYERGTLAQLYKNIEADLLKGLPLLANTYAKPKFHFTPDAGNAFAARFYLYYGEYQKAIDYATKVLGDNPAVMLRNWDYYNSLNANGQIQPEAYVAASERANLLLQTVYSEWGAIHGPYSYGDKYAHGYRIAYDETMRSVGPWGESAPNSAQTTGFKYTVWYNNSLSKFIFRKVPYWFEYTDLQAGIGYAHAEYPIFTTDMLLLERAEAYALLGNMDKAVADLNTELSVFHIHPNELTPENIKEFYNSIDYYVPKAYTVKTKDEDGKDMELEYASTPKKHLHPAFTDLGPEGETKESVIQCILHLRRILTLHEGFRMQDVKRYGITIYRRTMNSNYDIINVTDSLVAGDKRLAIQLPQDVITAGLEGNPRIQSTSHESLLVPMDVPADDKTAKSN